MSGQSQLLNDSDGVRKGVPDPPDCVVYLRDEAHPGQREPRTLWSPGRGPDPSHRAATSEKCYRENSSF